jgi:PAS domain S-box-containing protein
MRGFPIPPAHRALPALGGGAPFLLPAALLRLLLGWSRPELLVVGLLMGAGTVCGIIWALLLRARLQDQTGTLLQRLQRIAALEESYRELFENANDMVFTCALNGRFTSLNGTGERLTGFSRREALGMKIGDLIVPEHAARAEQMLAEGARPVGGETVELEILSRQGQRVPLEIRMRPILADGAAAGLQGIARDVAERQRAEQALRLSEQRYRTLVDNIPEVIWTADAEGQLVFVTGNTDRLDGYAPEETLQPDAWTSRIHPEDLERVMAAYQAHFRGGPTFDEEYRLRHKNKQWIWVHDRASTPHEKDGTFYTDGVLSDITARKLADEALRKSESRFRRLAESNMIGVTFGDATGLFLDANDAYLALVGYTRQDLEEGRVRWDNIIPPDQKDVLETIERKLGTTGVVEPVETVHLHKDGRRVPVLIGLARLEGEESQAIGFVIDLTERQRAAQELEDAKRAAEVANRAKSEFLANMSHEIRTPMNGIIGMTELALDTHLDREQRDYLEMVKESAESLLTLINDILDFSKIEAGKLTLDFTEFNLSDNLGHTVRSLAHHAHEKGLELAYEIAPEVPTALQGDPTRLRQIVVNLLGNAIKFTPQGEVVMRVEAESVTEQDAWLRFEVRDTGIGIPADKQRAIFDAFAQADGSMTRKYGGTGLGLAISRQLVELMGGRLGVESEVGRGSTFHFTVRLARQPVRRGAEPPAVFEMMDLRGLRVLVVDDNATNRRILNAMLKHWRMEPALAEGGVAGLTLMTENKKLGRSFPLVLLDAQMPDMDGFTLAEKIRHDPELATATIMMLTSAGQRGDGARCRELGISAYLIKPIRQSELLDAILMTLGKRPAGKGPALVTRHVLREARRRLRILVVEDNPVNQQLAARLLEKQGHEVALAANGREALATLAQAPSEFDAVVMDVQMPELDGLKATAEIRAQEEITGRHLPIVAMTARAMKGDRERCLAAGMDGYVAKPLRPEVFLGEIEAVCSGRAPAGAPSGRDAPAPSLRAKLLRRVDGDAELLGELADLFTRNSAKLLEAIRDAAARRDAPNLQFAAHQLKGSAANFGARGVCAVAEKLEALGRQGDCAHADEAVLELREEIAKLNSELQQFQKEGNP